MAHEGERLGRPSTWTAHRKQDAAGGNPSTWQSVGIRTPACRTAWRIVVPSSTVTVTPGERDPATLTVPITIHAERIKRDRYTASVGYGTDTGPRGQFV